MAKVKGLGKGLDALMGDASLQTQEAGSVLLPISQVEPGLNQPRKRFDDESLADLASSIEEHGIIQPLTVRRLSTGYYQIIAGERRWRAAKLAGRKEVPVVIIEADDRKVMEIGLIENLQREDLNPVEEAPPKTSPWNRPRRKSPSLWMKTASISRRRRRTCPSGWAGR